MQSEKEGVAPLVTLATRDGRTVIVGLPIDKGAAVKALLAKGAAIDPVDNGGETALTIAIHEGHDR